MGRSELKWVKSTCNGPNDPVCVFVCRPGRACTHLRLRQPARSPFSAKRPHGPRVKADSRLPLAEIRCTVLAFDSCTTNYHDQWIPHALSETKHTWSAASAALLKTRFTNMGSSERQISRPAVSSCHGASPVEASTWTRRRNVSSPSSDGLGSDPDVSDRTARRERP